MRFLTDRWHRFKEKFFFFFFLPSHAPINCDPQVLLRYTQLLTARSIPSSGMDGSLDPLKLRVLSFCVFNCINIILIRCFFLSIAKNSFAEVFSPYKAFSVGKMKENYVHQKNTTVPFIKLLL